LFSFKRPEIETNDAFDGGGLRFEVLEPSQKLRTVYEGNTVELADPRAMANPSKAFRQSPKRRVRLDLVHTAVGPMCGGQARKSKKNLAADQQFAKAH
jgi:hypothetical protein